MTSDEIERLRAELDQWRRLTDPQTPHANLLCGLPAQLTRERLRHLALADARNALANRQGELDAGGER